MISICSIDLYEVERKELIASFGQPTRWEKWEKRFSTPSYVALAMTAVFGLVQMLLSADAAVKIFPALKGIIPGS